MRRSLVSMVAALTLSLAAAGQVAADDLPFFDNPYLKGGGTPSGAGAYGLGARQTDAPSRSSAGPLSGQDNKQEIRRVERLRPGTGKFEGGGNKPCIGTTGFGSTSVIPGHKC